MSDPHAVYRRDRAIVLASLAGVSLLAWLYMVAMPAGAGHGGGHLISNNPSWTAADALTAFAIWTVMMVGMMIPTASPMISMFSATSRRQGAGKPAVPTLFFVVGYLIAWTGYSAAATAVQWGLQSTALLSPDNLQVGPRLGGALLIGAGLFQFTRLKNNCLTHCRTPMSFLMTQWREGIGGAVRMGLKHGTYCVGCCWAIMLLMFTAGLMNLVWTALLAVFMLLEKVVPAGDRLGRAAGVLAISLGAALVIDF